MDRGLISRASDGPWGKACRPRPSETSRPAAGGTKARSYTASCYLCSSRQRRADSPQPYIGTDAKAHTKNVMNVFFMIYISFILSK